MKKNIDTYMIKTFKIECDHSQRLGWAAIGIGSILTFLRVLVDAVNNIEYVLFGSSWAILRQFYKVSIILCIRKKALCIISFVTALTKIVYIQKYWRYRYSVSVSPQRVNTHTGNGLKIKVILNIPTQLYFYYSETTTDVTKRRTQNRTTIMK